MNTVWKLFLSVSFSGGALILALLAGKQLWRDRLSRQWQYYIWLPVILRLLIPFGPENSLLGGAYQAMDQAAVHAVMSAQPRETGGAPLPSALPDSPDGGDEEDSPDPAPPAIQPLRDGLSSLAQYAWVLWLAGALVLLIRKVTVYQGFVRYIRAGAVPVSNTELLDQLAAAAEQAGVKRPVDLWTDPLISSPLLIGCFRPCIVLPGEDISAQDLQHIVLHELTHYRRLDPLYKWLVQFTVCLHWFNPLVHLMSREISRACEFSCDEAVLAKTGCPQAYGKTLLNAMAAVGKYRASPGAVTLSENKQLLKERLGAIMNFRKRSGAARGLTCALTVCVLLGAVFTGVYPAAADQSGRVTWSRAAAADVRRRGAAFPQMEPDRGDSVFSAEAERYYEAESLPLFQIVFSRLDRKEQAAWLERCYEDGRVAFFSVCADELDTDSPAVLRVAERAYEDGESGFFSVAADRMSEGTLEVWLDKALEDRIISFQSILYGKLEWFDGKWADELDELEEALAQRQMEEYEAHGVTMDGKAYYYKGHLVNIFLDVRKDSSCYTLNVDPRGTVSIRISRDEDGEIESVRYMTSEEAEELLEDMGDTDDVETIPVDLNAMAAGETICLGEYALSEGDEIWYDISAETGKGMQVFFAKDERSDRVCWSVHNLRQPGEPLNCIADFTVGPPAGPGTYKLFIRAADGALGSVSGSISITPAEGR